MSATLWRDRQQPHPSYLCPAPLLVLSIQSSHPPCYFLSRVHTLPFQQKGYCRLKCAWINQHCSLDKIKREVLAGMQGHSEECTDILQPCMQLPRGFPACQYRRLGFHLCSRQISWRRKWPPTPVLLPGKSHGQRILAGYSPWGSKRVRHNLATKQQKYD